MSKAQQILDIASSSKDIYSLDHEERDSDLDEYTDNQGESEAQFTIRAALLGSILGCVVSASNIYLGLKSGFSFPASIFGAILGYAILKPWSKLPLYLGGGYFGIKENCTVQTAATAAGGLSVGFINGIPTMFRLELFQLPLDHYWSMLFLWTLAAGFYGLFFAIPLRSYFIIKQKLIFPSPTASANTILSLHSKGGKEAKIQTKWIMYSFISAFIYKVVGYFVPFIIDLHILWWISVPTGSKLLATIDVFWRWHFQLTTAFFGSGMIVGFNTAFSFFFGSVLAWGIIGPVLFYSDNNEIVKVSPWGYDKNKATVQSWNLWIGTVILLCCSFTELLMQSKSIFNGFKSSLIQLYNIIAKLFRIRRVEHNLGNNEDPVPENELVPTWMWVSGTIISGILTIIVLVIYFEMNVGAGILAIILGFMFSLIGCQAAGETDINPVGVIGKASQFVFAGIPGANLKVRQLNNLIAGSLAAACGSQAVDMVGDLKTGHILKASPRSQFYAQIVGSVFGVVIAVVLFMLFGKAYPCILIQQKIGSPPCEFPAPGVAAWTAVTQALTSDILRVIPESCRIACLVFGLSTIILVVLKNSYLKKYADYIPNWNAIGIAFINPAPALPIASVLGALIGVIWNKANPKYWKIMGIALASGLIAGEGTGGVFHAIFNIVGLDPKKVSTMFAMPIAL
ncbi:OPT superfamily oligopeptide transporter [Neoconidiobolus thromboides FSU 785]|nr:OPT superfamily oligopeptide transporter [Neoconidiobolus thromboides FSU 785]